MYRALVAVGTLLKVSDEIRQVAKSVYSIERIFEGISRKFNEPRVRELLAEINLVE